MKIQPKLAAYFEDYEGFHRDPRNIWAHIVGVYPIVVGTLGLLSQVSLGEFLNLGLALWTVISIWYFTLDSKVALLMLPLTGFCLYLGSSLSPTTNLYLFLGGWTLQFWGHLKWEKNSPALFKTLAHLWIAPVWLAAKASRRLKVI
jgi:uncharacterized membrane protein YGL010W